jgi:hypothetical protein
MLGILVAAVEQGEAFVHVAEEGVGILKAGLIATCLGE